ncbi:SpoIIE family protein phosphatase [Streptomyces sp. NPDC055287]
MLDTLFNQSPVGLRLLDTDLRLVRVNPATAAMRGVEVKPLVGHRFPEPHHTVEPRVVETLLEGVLKTGVPVLQHTVRGYPDADPQHEHVYEFSIFRLEDPHGKVLGVVTQAVEVTERERSRDRARILGAVRERVGRSLDVVVACQDLVDTLVPAFADIAVIEVVDSVLQGDNPPPSPVPQQTAMRRVAFRSVREHPPQAHPLGSVHGIPAPTPYTQPLTDLRPRVLPLSSDLPWLQTDPARSKAIRESGAHTLLTVPLTLHGTVLGLISLYRTQGAETFDEDDVETSSALADHTALCIENARRYTREHSIAATVRRGLLPRSPASRTGLETALIPPTSDEGGSWYDTIPLSSARTALVIGKVSGTGIDATATLGQLRTVIRSLAASGLEPDELLARLNDTAVFLAAERSSLPIGDPLHREALTASCVYAVYDPLTQNCTIAAAGHPAPVLARPDGSAEILDIPTGPPLGGAEETPFAASDIKIPEGSVLAFIDPPTLIADALAGSDRLRQAWAAGHRTLQDLCDEIQYERLLDTSALCLLARTRAFPPDRHAAWELDNDLSAPAIARRHVRAQLANWHIDPDTASNTELIVSELVTNAVRYGSPPIELRMINDQTLTCEVRDSGLAAPHLRHARTVDEGGRGLYITAQLTQIWGTRYTPDGKTIWTEQPRPAMSR